MEFPCFLSKETCILILFLHLKMVESNLEWCKRTQHGRKSKNKKSTYYKLHQRWCQNNVRSSRKKTTRRKKIKKTTRKKATSKSTSGYYVHRAKRPTKLIKRTPGGGLRYSARGLYDSGSPIGFRSMSRGRVKYLALDKNGRPYLSLRKP